MPIGASFPGVLDAATVGAEWAWRLLWDDLAGPIAGYGRAKGVDPEELVSEVFAQMAGSMGRFAGDEGQFRSWVFTIAHHRIVDQHRRSGRRPEVPRPEMADTPVAATDPAMIFEQSEAEDRAMAMLSKLSPDQREVVALRILGELSLEEVAEIVGKKVNAVKQLQFRALNALRKEFSLAGVTR